MANTYRKMYLQVVFAVKYRQALLLPEWRGEVFKYMAGIINQRGHYSLAVNGVSDHVHLFFDYNGRELVEDLIREVKKASNHFINDQGFITDSNFAWQVGYGVFSHGWREKDILINYVKNQEVRHREVTFKSEYLQCLNDYEIEFKEEYVFDFFDL